MKYELKDPLEITSRLLVGFKAGDATVSIDTVRQQGDGRVVYRWFVDFEDGREFSGDDLKSGCQGGNLADGLGNFCSFLSAFADAQYHMSRNPDHEPDCVDIFPADLAEWAMENSEEIGMVGIEIEESADSDKSILIESP